MYCHTKSSIHTALALPKVTKAPKTQGSGDCSVRLIRMKQIEEDKPQKRKREVMSSAENAELVENGVSSVYRKSTKNVTDTKKHNRKNYRQQLEENILQKSPTNVYVVGEIVLGTIPGIQETIYIQFFGTGEV